MKRVVDSDQVCHLWANQSQSDARNKQGNVYFDGATIYSYGSHFPMARIVTRKGKGSITLFTSHRYSATTSGHLCQARRAASHHRTITVDNVMVNDEWTKAEKNGAALKQAAHSDNLEYFAKQIDGLTKRALRARSNSEYLWNCAAGTVNSANDYCAFFGIRKRFKMPDAESVKKQIAAQKVAAKKQAELAEKKRQQAIADAQEVVEQWKQGADVSIPWIVSNVYLRVQGDKLQTSKGATVPLDHAKRLLPYIRSGAAYQHNGHSLHVGQFRVDSIDEHGNLVAGCHSIKREEIDRVASLLNV